MTNLVPKIKRIDQIDARIARGMGRIGPVLLTYSIAVVFIWFGWLKILGISPAQELVQNTVYWFQDPAQFVVILGYWEVVIGLTMCFRPLLRISLFLLFLQMPGTFLPLILLPQICFTDFPLGLTMEGQYIVKNLVLISAALVVGGTVRSRTASGTCGQSANPSTAEKRSLAVTHPVSQPSTLQVPASGIERM